MCKMIIFVKFYRKILHGLLMHWRILDLLYALYEQGSQGFENINTNFKVHRRVEYYFIF